MSEIGKIIRVNELPPTNELETNSIYQVSDIGSATYTDYAVDENGDIKVAAIDYTHQDVVNLTGDQTVDGYKTFAKPIIGSQISKGVQGHPTVGSNDVITGLPGAASWTTNIGTNCKMTFKRSSTSPTKFYVRVHAGSTTNITFCDVVFSYYAKGNYTSYLRVNFLSGDHNFFKALDFYGSYDSVGGVDVFYIRFSNHNYPSVSPLSIEFAGADPKMVAESFTIRISSDAMDSNATIINGSRKIDSPYLIKGSDPNSIVNDDGTRTHSGNLLWNARQSIASDGGTHFINPKGQLTVITIDDGGNSSTTMILPNESLKNQEVLIVNNSQDTVNIVQENSSGGIVVNQNEIIRATFVYNMDIDSYVEGINIGEGRWITDGIRSKTEL